MPYACEKTFALMGGDSRKRGQQEADAMQAAMLSVRF